MLKSTVVRRKKGKTKMTVLKNTVVRRDEWKKRTPIVKKYRKVENDVCLKGVFAKNEWGYRLSAIKKRF